VSGRPQAVKPPREWRTPRGEYHGTDEDMRKVIVSAWMSLDGVVQAPAAADEDRSVGSNTAAGACATSMRPRRTRRSRTSLKQEQAIAGSLSTKPKYVASTTLTEPLEWQNSTLLQGDVAEALGQKQGANLHVTGSTELVQTLIEQSMVDEFRLVIDPLLLGGGKRIFGADGALRPLRLVHSQVTTTGAILAIYVAADRDRPVAVR
jgi:dihydrofolate reductase